MKKLAMIAIIVMAVATSTQQPAQSDCYHDCYGPGGYRRGCGYACDGYADGGGFGRYYAWYAGSFGGYRGFGYLSYYSGFARSYEAQIRGPHSAPITPIGYYDGYGGGY